MKPAFALSFSDTGISLDHHSDGDWFSIGTVSLDAPDLETQIKALQEKGFALENDLSCKVILPPDQIRYLSVRTEGLSADERDQKIYDALSQATPYDVSELTFDTSTLGSDTCIAAVARETLQEARDFATQYGFIPVLFSADARAQEFPREPGFDLAAPPLSVSPSSAPAADEIAPGEVTASDEPDIPEEPGTREEPDIPDISAIPDVPDTPSEPNASEESDTREDTQTTGPAVHAIADTAAPDAFRSPVPLTIPGAASERPPLHGAKRYAIPAVAAVVCIGLAIAVWSVLGPEPDIADIEPAPPHVQQPGPDTQVAGLEEAEEAEPALAANENPLETPSEDTTQTPDEDQPELTPTDAAILEALQVPPTPVEQVARESEALEDIEAVAGLSVTPPITPDAPVPAEPEDQYLASIDRFDLSTDAVALPPVASFETDPPFVQPASPGDAGAGFDLDERGLVTPTPEGALNPDGVLVFLGPPPSVPPEAPVRFEEAPVIEEEDNQRLAQLRPRPRPENLIEQFERQQLGGRSLEELSILRPKLRPESLQASPQIDETPTALAVVRVPRPKVRPAGLAAAAAAARVASASTANLGSTAAVDQTSDEAGSFQAKAVAPKIPSSASVARQATIDNAINLRRLNLIGVYGTPANRRALVRLPSGRYKKLKVGDRIDGGRVIAISESELRYEKRGRNLTLKMPRG